MELYRTFNVNELSLFRNNTKDGSASMHCLLLPMVQIDLFVTVFQAPGSSRDPSILIIVTGSLNSAYIIFKSVQFANSDLSGMYNHNEHAVVFSCTRLHWKDNSLFLEP